MTRTVRIITSFGIISGVATIFSLRFPQQPVFWICVAAFLAHLVGEFAFGHFVLARIAIGSKRTLDVIGDVMEHAVGQDIFAYAAFNVNEVLAEHPYMRRTIALLHDGHFDRYTRIVAVRHSTDVRLAEDMLRRFGRNPKVRFGIHLVDRALPLNILLVSPSHISLGLPREPTSREPLGDSLVIYIRSRRLYESFRMLAASLWDSSIVLSGSHAMTDAEIDRAALLLQSTLQHPLEPAITNASEQNG